MLSSRIKNTIKVSDGKLNALEKFLLILFSAYIVLGVFANSTMGTDMMRFIRAFRFIIYGLFILDIFMDLLSGNKKITLPTVILLISAMVIFLFSRQKTPLVIALLFFELSRFRFSDIVKYLSVALFVSVAVVILLSLAGIFENVAFSRGDRIRYGLGFDWTTTGPSTFFFAALGWIYVRKTKITYYELAAIIAVAAVLFYFTDSRLAFGASVVAVLCSLSAKIIKKTSADAKIKSAAEKRDRAIRIVLTALPTAIFVLSLLLVLYYVLKLPLYDKLNSVLSDRLRLTVRAFKEYGISPFGKNIEWRGWDPDSFFTRGYDYLYVDNSYIKALFDFGVLGIILTLTGYTFALRAAWKNKNYFLTFMLVLCLIHGAIAPSLLSHTSNAFLFAIAPFSIYCVYSSEEFLRKKASFYGKLEPISETAENYKDSELVSVIVPVYNVASCMEATVDCILKQDYKNLEILLIDDGSTDGSDKICDEYAKADGRIRVIHAQHAGLSAVRNRGLSESRGSYIVFVDSDDLITEDYISYMYRLIKKDDSARFSACGVCTVRGECEPLTEKDDLYRVFNVEQAFESMLYDEGLFLTVCGKLFRAEFVKKFTFPVGRAYEDSAVLYKMIDTAVKIVYGQQPCYYYISRGNSISTAKNYGQKDVDYQEFTENMLNSIENNHPELIKPITRFRLYYNFRLMRILLFSATRNAEKENEIWGNIKKLRFKAISDVNLPVRDVFAICISLFGKRFFRFCWSVYRKITHRVV